MLSSQIVQQTIWCEGIVCAIFNFKLHKLSKLSGKHLHRRIQLVIEMKDAGDARSPPLPVGMAEGLQEHDQLLRRCRIITPSRKRH